MPTTTVRRRTARASDPLVRTLPPNLLLLARLLGESPTAMQTALTAARDAIERYADPRNDQDTLDIEPHIQSQAEFGPFAKAVKRALDTDPGNMVGTLMSAYAVPGALTGCALAWLTLSQETTSRPRLSPLALRSLLRTIGNYEAGDADAAIDHALQLASGLLNSTEPFAGHIDDPDPTIEILRRVALDSDERLVSTINAILDNPTDDHAIGTTTSAVFAIVNAAITQGMLTGAAVMHDMITGGTR